MIDDVNDHAPLFERAFRRVQLAEDSPIGHEIVQMIATDDDDGDNALISYMLLSRTSLFTIDRRTGTVRVAAQLDRETTAAHTLQVMAIDHGTPAKRFVHSMSSSHTLMCSSTSTLHIDVLDVNDNAPRCVVRTHVVHVAEKWANNALLTCMVAVDDDTGDNGRMTFGWDVSHRHEQLPFRITPTTGCVWLTGLLNYETRTTYNLSVEVSDNGQPQFSSICNLLVNVHDVNENMYAPQFDTFAKEMKVYGKHGTPN
jgi:hypothetical protein